MAQLAHRLARAASPLPSLCDDPLNLHRPSAKRRRRGSSGYGRSGVSGFQCTGCMADHIRIRLDMAQTAAAPWKGHMNRLTVI